MCICVHVYTASTCHQKASSVRQPDTSSIAQESEDRESGAVTSLLGDSGMVTTEINTLQMPGT